MENRKENMHISASRVKIPLRFLNEALVLTSHVPAFIATKSQPTHRDIAAKIVRCLHKRFYIVKRLFWGFSYLKQSDRNIRYSYLIFAPA